MHGPLGVTRGGRVPRPCTSCFVFSRHATEGTVGLVAVKGQALDSSHAPTMLFFIVACRESRAALTEVDTRIDRLNLLSSMDNVIECRDKLDALLADTLSSKAAREEALHYFDRAIMELSQEVLTAELEELRERAYEKADLDKEADLEM